MNEIRMASFEDYKIACKEIEFFTHLCADEPLTELNPNYEEYSSRIRGAVIASVSYLFSLSLEQAIAVTAELANAGHANEQYLEKMEIEKFRKNMGKFL